MKGQFAAKKWGLFKRKIQVQPVEVGIEKKRTSYGLQISRGRLKLLAKQNKGKWYLE